MPPLTHVKKRDDACAPAIPIIMGAYDPLDEVKLVADDSQFPLTATPNNHPCAENLPISPSLDRLIVPTNQSINPAASPVNSLNDSLISFRDHFSSSDFHSFSSNDLSEHNPQAIRISSWQSNPPSSPDTIMSSNSSVPTIHVPMSLDQTSLIRPQSDKTSLNNHASSTVPFKWEETPGKPIPTSTLNIEVARHSDEFAYASPLQLPPKLKYPQSQHRPLQSSCSVEDFVDGFPAYNLQPIHQRPPSHSPHGFHLLSQSRPFEFPPSPRHSPSILHQKFKKVCTSLLIRSSSWSQPLHKLAPPCSSFACHGSSCMDEEEEKTGTCFDRFFFDKASLEDFKHNASMDSWKPTLPTYEESQKQFPALPIFDKSQTEDEFVSRDALKFLAMEDHETESFASSPWQPIPYYKRQGSGVCSWPPASIINLQDIDDEGFHDFFSPTSTLEMVSQRIEDGHTDSACSTPLPWFLDFSPHMEENNHVVNKARNKMSLVRLVAIIRLKSIISNKVCKLRRGRSGGAYQQDKSMWSPTLATYLYNNLQNKETLKESTPAFEHVSEDEQSNSDEGHLRINYHLPSSIKGQKISNHYYLDDDLVSPNQARLAAISPSFSADEKEKPQKAIRTPSLIREQLAQLNDEDLCSLQTKDYPHTALERRDCKWMCKFRRTVQVLATRIKLISPQVDDGMKGAKRPSLSYRSSLKTIFPLSSPPK